MDHSVITSSELKIRDHANGFGSSSTMSVFQSGMKMIEFHKARNPLNGLGNGINNNNDREGFKIETINPTNSDHRKQCGNLSVGCSVTKGRGSDFEENGLELSFGITVRRIGAGLENLGNTCFLNSVVQCLTYTEPLAAYLQSGKHNNSCRIAGFCALCAIQKHVSRARQLSGRSLAPKDLVSNLRRISRSFRYARQEDAHEYMVNLLEAMHKCCLPSGVPTGSASAYENSLVHRIFGGRLRSQVQCTQCSHSSNTFDPFLDLSLELYKVDSLHKALLNFTAAEELDGGEKQYQCENCKQKVRALKRLTVDKAPHVLNIHLKRFRSYDGQKIDKKVAFGSTLDVKPFVSGPDRGDLRYTLYGVLVHYGWSNHSGHYSCFVRTSSGMWYSLDDSQVGQVSERTVLDQKAYMLFYVRDRKHFLPRKPVNFLQKENLKANVNSNEICSVFNQRSKEQAGSSSVENKLKVKSLNTQKANVNSNEMCSVFNQRSKEQAWNSSVENNLKVESLNTQKANVNSNEICSVFNQRTKEQAGNISAENKLKVESLNAQKEVIFNGSSKESSVMTESLMPKKDLIVEPALSASLKNNPSGISDKIPDLGEVKPSSFPSVNSTTPYPGKTSIAIDSKIDDCQVNGISKTILGVSVDPIRNGLQNSAGDKPDNVVSGSSAHIVKGKAGPLSASSDVEIECLNSTVKAEDDIARKKLKKKTKNKKKCQITSMHVGLKLNLLNSTLGLRKKKLKRTKRRTSKTHIGEHLLAESSVSSNLGPSTSEKSMANSLVSSHSQNNHSRKAATKSESGPSMNIMDRDSSDRQNQNGAVLATEQLQLGSSSIMERSQQNASEPSELMNVKLNGTVRKNNAQSLAEIVVPRWDETKSPSTAEVSTMNTSIGYLPDEWDEAYDMGKRKKVREPTVICGGPNRFQELSSSRSKFKKARTDRYRNQQFRI
ncbi:ubiquitin carboxyl-terminal hydrolase 23-like [Rutidosis leptorrhynchoides]|uniref:ubiquitin carboxyl-terminal hydrolase 23-like n=1 Tax=Rutidosis leptorrhynchoides TaxID=125765 RepID=UPI003A9A5167